MGNITSEGVFGHQHIYAKLFNTADKLVPYNLFIILVPTPIIEHLGLYSRITKKQYNCKEKINNKTVIKSQGYSLSQFTRKYTFSGKIYN